jgi:hypothetical protein
MFMLNFRTIKSILDKSANSKFNTLSKWIKISIKSNIVISFSFLAFPIYCLVKQYYYELSSSMVLLGFFVMPPYTIIGKRPEKAG